MICPIGHCAGKTKKGTRQSLFAIGPAKAALLGPTVKTVFNHSKWVNFMVILWQLIGNGLYGLLIYP